MNLNYEITPQNLGVLNKNLIQIEAAYYRNHS